LFKTAQSINDRLPGQGEVAMSAAMPKWFAVYTTPRHEKRIAEHFSQRGIDFFLPLYRSQRKWKDGSRVQLELPLFPSYVFVRIGKGERVRVLEVPGVLWVVGSSGRDAVSLPDSDIDTMRTGLHLRSAEPHPLPAVGQRVRIRSGALASLEGIMIRKKNELRVVITLDQINQSIAVEVDSDDIEPVAEPLTVASDRQVKLAPDNITTL
jgi:transcription antitermination factor NusG